LSSCYKLISIINQIFFPFYIRFRDAKDYKKWSQAQFKGVQHDVKPVITLETQGFFIYVLRMSEAQQTPSMQQYLRAKAQNPDCILFFRMGDFYETFFEDAITTSKVLGIALTSRNKDDKEPIPMAGVPYHAVTQYLQRMVQAGYKVAICEQMEDPKQAKGLVRREVIRVVTPGVLLDTEIQDQTSWNYLCAIKHSDKGIGFVALDPSTGAFQGQLIRSLEELKDILGKLEPKEILLSNDEPDKVSEVVRGSGACITNFEDKEPTPKEDLIGDGFSTPVKEAGKMVLAYLARANKALLSIVKPIEPLFTRDTMLLPANTVRNLELMERWATRGTRGSLYSYLNKTQSPMGARLLRSCILAPLMDIREIERRLDAVEFFAKNIETRVKVREALKGIADIERLVSRVASGSASARELTALANAIMKADECRKCIQQSPLASSLEVVSELMPLANGILETFVENPPSTTKEGGMVRKGVSKDLDEAREMAEGGRKFIAQYEAKERQRTGIPNLKIRFNRVFGYTIEVTKSYQDKVPNYYIRKQTLAGAERYVTEELIAIEQKVTNAEERAKAIEANIFEEWRQKVLSETKKLQSLSSSISWLDMFSALGEVAHSKGYSRPKVLSDKRIKLVKSRHPLVEEGLRAGEFVPNDFFMDGEKQCLYIITGPNMAGKSTLMRQIALCAIMAQMGSFVPAEEAEIGIVDAVFTRVGALDDIGQGQSTFMVEMVETAEILKKATDRSLVLMDEVGRGTSTFDGVAIAWAVAEYLHNEIGCRTLFATHYHELTDIVRVLEKAKNMSIQVKEWGGNVIFLRKLVDGPSNKSFGIQVARLADLPQAVLDRAKEVLKNLERVELDVAGKPVLAHGSKKTQTKGPVQLELFSINLSNPLIDKLASLDIERLSPLEAFTILCDLVSEAKRFKS
jgi:DNA mismatch repair protein MutS